MLQKLLFTLIIIVIASIPIDAQADSIFPKLSFELDFRFRAEQDWDSKKPDGTFRDKRSRLRYRVRTGVSYKRDNYKVGLRIRTGDQNKQQDPQLTLGKGFKEFGTLPIGFEKVYLQFNKNNSRIWLGKNSFSFEKNNELFWSDNVFPEGAFIQHRFNLSNSAIDNVLFRGAHYILTSNGTSFLEDAYFQGIQSLIQFSNQRLKLFPAFYILRNIADIPDGNHSFEIDYSIIHLGGKLKALKSKNLFIDFDIYQNLEDYQLDTNIPKELADEKMGYSLGIQYGALEKRKDWKIKLTYTALQKYAALDYMAQNDWARWDYSSFNSPDGRLTNLKGIELVAGYNLSKKMNLIAKYYHVNQIIRTGGFKETGQRIRFDLNVSI